MTVTELVSAFGNYYLNHGQNQNSIYSQLYQGFVTEQVFTQVITDDTIWRASESRHGRIVQPFQRAFTPTGTAEFKPVEIRQFNIKADLSEYPDDIKGMWLGFLASMNVKRTDWPYVKYWMEKMIIPRIQQDQELFEIGRGVYAAPTNNVAGPAGTAMDGIQKIINDHVAATRIVPIALGAIPTDEVQLVEYFEEYADGIPSLYQEIPMNSYVPQRLMRPYKRGFRKKYGKDADFTENANGTVSVKYANLTLVGLPSMNLKANGSLNDRIFTTPKENAIMLRKGPQNSKGIFDIQAQDRQVKLMTDWWMGVGFIIPELVWVNDGAA